MLLLHRRVAALPSPLHCYSATALFAVLRHWRVHYSTSVKRLFHTLPKLIFRAVATRTPARVISNPASIMSPFMGPASHAPAHVFIAAVVMNRPRVASHARGRGHAGRVCSPSGKTPGFAQSLKGNEGVVSTRLLCTVGCAATS